MIAQKMGLVISWKSKHNINEIVLSVSISNDQCLEILDIIDLDFITSHYCIFLFFSKIKMFV